VSADPLVGTNARARTNDAASNIAFFAVAGTSLLLPLIVDLHGDDSFRLPKELAFRAGATGVLVAFVFALTRRKPLRIDGALLRRAPIALPLSAIVWTAISTLTSVHLAASVESLVTVIAGAAFFIGTYAAMRGEGLIALDIAFIPAIVNATLVILQEYGIWQPFTFPPAASGHMSSSALIGNPNDVGAYLVIPAIAAAVGTAATRGLRRALYSLVGLILLAGVIASGTRTAVITYAVALGLFAMRRSLRSVIIVAILLAAAAAATFSTSTHIGRSMRDLAAAAKAQRYDVLLSGRIPAFICAAEMWREHPITGLGPGTFKYAYMPTKIALRTTPAGKWFTSSVEFFGVAHNDHLQLLAEGGLPAYAIFLAALIILASPLRRGLRSEEVGAKRAFARELRLPLALSVLVLALAQFPLQIAAPRMVIFYFAALCMTWDPSHAT
jgi:O-antigen ligase